MDAGSETFWLVTNKAYMVLECMYDIYDYTLYVNSKYI